MCSLELSTHKVFWIPKLHVMYATATTKLASTPLQVHERQKNDVLAAMFCLEIAHRLKVRIHLSLACTSPIATIFLRLNATLE